MSRRGNTRPARGLTDDIRLHSTVQAKPRWERSVSFKPGARVGYHRDNARLAWKLCSNQSPSRAPRAATRGGSAAARAACVSTWLGEMEAYSGAGVATSMIARHKKPRHDLIVVLHLKSCGAAEKSLRGCIEVATPRLRSFPSEERTVR